MYGILLLFLTQQKILILSVVITGNILFGLSEVAAWIECAGSTTHDAHPITSVLTSAHYTEFALRELALRDCLMSVTGDLVICILKSASVGEYFAMFGAAQLV